ncbi:MAG: hypothetical protein ACRCXL_15080 [Dermatophilaceae bacterium]
MEPTEITWKAMAPEEVLRILTFWNNAPWPLSRDQVKERAIAELGWTLNDEGFLDDNVTGLTPPTCRSPTTGTRPLGSALT